ncbi:MAG: FHA domain-containing protein, partial [Pseudomonadota bacterium]
MGLTLKLQGSGALPTGVDRVAIKDGALTIGRGAENDLALPDPSRQVSKRHCVIEERDGSYVLIDVSTNGTFVNYGGDRIGEMGTVVGHGDVISIGPYELVIELSAEMPEMAPNPYASAHLPPAPDTESFERAPGGGVQASGHSLDDIASVLDGSGDPLGAGGGLGGSDDGLDALLGEGAPRAPQPGQAPIWRDAGARADRLADAGPVIPEDDDDFLSGPGDDPFQPGVGATADHAAGTNTFFRPTTAPLPADDLASDPAAPTGGAIGAPGAGGSIGGGGGSVGGGAMIPDDWEDDLLGGEPPAAPAGPPQGGPNADRASGPDFGASLNPHAPSGAAGLDAQPAGRPAPTAVSSGGGTGDPFADILDEPVDPPMPPAAAPAPPPAPPTPPASRAEAPQPAAPQPAVRDPVAREPAAGTAAARPTPPPAAAGGGGTDAATRAFLRAAGIEPGEMSEAEAIETMARCG